MERTDYSQVRLTATKSIRAKCLDCCCGQQAEVRRCTVKTCALWRYRMGKEQRDELYQLAHPKVENPGTDDDFDECEADSDE